MKMPIIIFVILLGMLSCDPDVPGEGINLPPMEFGLTVSPDTAYLNLGDTLVLYSSISSTLNNGVIITDGNAKIDLYFGYCSETPVSTKNFETVIENVHANFFEQFGTIDINPSYGNLKDISAMPYNDSIKFELLIVPLKVGTYCFQTQSLFYEGSKGKTRTIPRFDVKDYNWSLWQKEPQPDPNDGIYSRTFYFAVTE